MYFPTLVLAVIAIIPVFSVHATLSEDFQAFVTEHPEVKEVNSNDADFLKAKSSAFQTNTPSTSAAVVPNAYIIQLNPGTGLSKREGNAHTEFHKRASTTINYSTRREFTNTSVFFGLSIQVNDDASASTIKDLPNVLAVWPVRRIPRPSSVGYPIGVFNNTGTLYNVTASAGPGADVNSPHRMTDVDRLHDLGIKGSGIKIALMDTGVDYRHPALGGCFGSGCKIAFGTDFVGDDYGDTGVAVPDDDPLATCLGGGHGSHTTGIIAMQDGPFSPFGLVGVAPEATIGMYRIFGCDGGAEDDVLLQAFEQAATDAVDVLSISLGSIEEWEDDDPYAIVTANLEAAGIAVIAAAGNYGGSPALTSSPASGPKVISVGCAQNSYFPTIYTATDSMNQSIKYSGNPWPVAAPDTGLKVYDITKLAANSTSAIGCSDDAWTTALASIPDVNSSIIAVPATGTPGCSWGTLLTVAGEYGFPYSVVYAEAGRDIFNLDYNSLEPNIPFYGFTINQADGIKLLNGLSQSSDYRLYFPTDIFESDLQGTAGLMSNFSSTGPTSDTLALKPQLSAPGESILSTWPLTGAGYAILSGTSMSTPYVAGSYALVKSQYPNDTVQEIRERIQSTSRSISYAYDKAIRDSPTQQGAGLINVYNAVFVGSAVSPSELNLGDLDELKPQEITIENQSNEPKTYVITHEPAGETNLLPVPYALTLYADPVSLPDQYAQYASVDFSTTSITLQPGESANFTATFTPSTGTPDNYLPVYGGFIKVTSGEDEFTITYIGQPYSRQKADFIDATNNTGLQIPLLLNSNALGVPIREIGVFDFNLTGDGYPYLEWITLQSSQYFRIELLPYNTTFIPDFYGFIFNESNPYGVPDSALPLVYPDIPLVTTIGNVSSFGIDKDSNDNNRPSGFLWALEPQLFDESGDSSTGVPVGDYRALLRVLRWDANATEAESYQTWLSPVIRIVSGDA